MLCYKIYQILDKVIRLIIIYDINFVIIRRVLTMRKKILILIMHKKKKLRKKSLTVF